VELISPVVHKQILTSVVCLADVAAVHPKAMPVILIKPAVWETWLAVPWPQAMALQRPVAEWIVADGAEPEDAGLL